MPRANKTARISTGGYYPPRGLNEFMEPHEEEEPHEQEVDSPTPAPSPKLFQEEPEEEEPKEVEVILLSDDDDDEEDAIQEDEPIPPLGWTTKVWYKLGCESSISHHRLVGILQTYYANWDAAVDYVYNEHTHPLEVTYWKTRVCISIKDEQKEAY